MLFFHASAREDALSEAAFSARASRCVCVHRQRASNFTELTSRVCVCMKVILRHKDLHAYGKICESVHKTASANKICKRKRSFVKV